MSAPTAPSPTLAPEETQALFRSVFRQLPSGVSVLTTVSAAGPTGMTVSAVCSLSVDPLLALACVCRGSSTLQAILDHGSFAINVLGADAGAISTRFAAGHGPGDRFGGTGYRWAHGLPLLDRAVAWITCSVHDTLPGGDHTILVGAVTDLDGADGEPLVWHGGRYRRLA